MVEAEEAGGAAPSSDLMAFQEDLAWRKLAVALRAAIPRVRRDEDQGGGGGCGRAVALLLRECWRTSFPPLY